MGVSGVSGDRPGSGRESARRPQQYLRLVNRRLQRTCSACGTAGLGGAAAPRRSLTPAGAPATTGYTLTRGTPAQVAEEVRRRIREIGPGGGYCVGSSNSIPNYVPLDNHRAMLEATSEYGRYPLSC